MDGQSTADQEIFVKFRKLLADKLRLKEDAIKKDSHFVDDIGIDSVDFWEVIAKVEQEFRISVEDADVKEVNTVQDVIDVLRRKLKEV